MSAKQFTKMAVLKKLECIIAVLPFQATEFCDILGKADDQNYDALLGSLQKILQDSVALCTQNRYVVCQ